MISIQITAFYAALLTLFYIALAGNVIRKRFKHQVGLGDRGNITVLKAIRVHGNFGEYIPLALLLLAMFEISGGSETSLHVYGGILIVSRILHALGLSKSHKTSPARALGTLMLYGVLIALSDVHIINYI